MIKQKTGNWKTKELRGRRIAGICGGVIVLAGLAVLAFVDFGVLADRFKAMGYEPSAEMQSLMDDVKMTERGELVLKASQPQLLAQADFNDTCESHNPDLSVLGCYTAERIYVYDVKNVELDGVRQSTLAHELLHAVWYRMSGDERVKFEPMMKGIYDAHADELKPRLDKYPEADFDDELHSIVGTEIAVGELPEELAKHYARYFSDHAKVVSYHEAYSEKFEKLKKETDELYAKITANQEKIDAETTNYNDGTVELNAAITDFNRRAENGSFVSMAAFNAERAALVSRQRALDNLHNTISSLVDATNELIGKYNDSVVRTQELVDSINSNTVAPETEIKDE